MKLGDGITWGHCKDLGVYSKGDGESVQSFA